MADLKTTNIFGDAYINNKVGIATNAPATRLQIGQLSPTAATEGLQFGDDTGARLHRINTGHIRSTGGFSSATFIIADNYLQTNNNLIYPASQTATQRLEVGNASGNAWIDGLTIAQGGNVTVYNNLTVNNAATVTNDLTVNGNTYLGNAGGDTVFVNDIIRIGATDSGDASLFFGEGSVAGSDYGARWYWDSGYTFTWYTRNAGTDTALFDYVTNDLNYINWRRHFHMQNKEINYNAQIHFNAGTRFVGNNTSYLNFRSDSAGAGGILVQDGNATTKGYTGYWDSAGGGILNDSGNWAVRYNFGNANSGGTLYGAWTVNGNISATNLSGTNTGDQTIGNGTITIAAGTGIGVGTSNTFTTNQSGATTVTVTNSGVTSNVAGTGISVSGATGAVTITNSGVTSAVAGTGISVSGATGAVTITNSGVTSLAGTTNRITVSAGTGGITLNLPQDIHTGASPTFAGLSLTSVSTTGATITNLTGAYQNTTVYDSPRTQSATPSRGIRAPASSIQFTDSYAIAPFYTYRSTGDWPVPYGIGWGTGGESSGIFQRYASNGSSFGDMIFYTGNDGYGAFSFRRHTWEGTTYFAAGSGELNTELFRIDWSGNVSMLGTLNGSANSATFYANPSNYGSWKIGGTRNGWYGIEFESGTNLMANSNEVGFHRNGSGWQMRWSAGVGYVYKGNPGGGTEAVILDSSNSPYANNMNQYVRTTDSPTFAVLQLTRLNFGATGAAPYAAASGEGFGNGITFGGDENSAAYRIFTGMENIGGNYSKLTLNWHTGIRIGAYFGYGGIRFYNNYVGTGTKVFSIAEGDDNVRVANELFVGTDNIGAYKFMKYGGTRSGDWQLFTTSSVGAGQMNVIQVENIGGGGHTNYPTGVYTYGGVMSWRLPNHSFQLYAAHTGDLAYKTQWNNDNYSGWRRILDSSTYPYAANMNQYVRTTDTCSFAAVTATTFTGALSGNATTATSINGFGNPTTNSTANTIVYREGNGYITNNYFHTSGGGSERNASGMAYFAGFNSSDYYIRSYTAAAVATLISGQTMNINGSSTSAGCVNSDTGNVGENRLQYWQTSGNTTLNPDTEWYNAIRMGHGNPVTYYGNTLAVKMTGTNLGDIYTRTLTNGTQGSWNRFWNNNNDGAGSGLDADLVDGLDVHTGRNDNVNKIVRTDSNGYIQAGWINTTSGDNGTTAIDRVYASSDAYVRYYTPANFRTVLDVPTRGGSGASGNWGINITGNAATATTATTAGTANAVASAAVKAAGLDSSVEFTMTGLTSNSTIKIFPSYVSPYSSFLRMGYDNTGNYEYTIKRDGTTGFLEFYNTQANYTGYYFRINGSGGGLGIAVSPASRLHVNGDGTNPAVRVDNTGVVLAASVGSNGRTFYGWLPISVDGTTRWIRIFS